MTYDGIIERLRHTLATASGLSERTMFGGVSFTLDGNVCCGVLGGNLVVRVGPEHYHAVLAEPFTRPMDFTGRPLRGFVYVSPAGYASESDLRCWVGRAVAFARTLPPKHATVA